MSGDADGEDGDHDSSFMQLPIGDLFLALGSAFLVALLLAQGLRVQAAPAPAPVEDNAAMKVVATETGLILPNDAVGQRLTIGLDEMNSRPDLTNRLQKTVEAKRPVLLVIGENGGESAFLFEGVAREAGVARLLRLRLDPECRFAPEPLSADACHTLLGRLSAGG